MILDENDIRSIVEQLKKELLPIGSILIYPSENVPPNFLPCDGRELSKSLFPELYNLIKGTWGETESTFSLPDLQGQFVRGWDKDGNIDPERKFGEIQNDAFQGHGHKLKIEGETAESGSHSHPVYYRVQQISYGTNTISDNHHASYVWKLVPRDEYWERYNDPLWRDDYKDQWGGYTGSHKHALPPMSVVDPETCANGVVDPKNETRPKNIALMFCIKVK